MRSLVTGSAIIVLALGLVIYGASTVHGVNTRSLSWSESGPIGQNFAFEGMVLSPDVTSRIIAGSTGVVVALILSSADDFPIWVCQHFTGNSSCGGLGGGNVFNSTILNSYLTLHPSAVVYSRMIAGENVTLDYSVMKPTRVFVVVTALGSESSRYYLQRSQTNQTLSYPLLGYTEHASGIATLPNIALAITGSGAAVIAVVLIQSRSKTRRAEVSSQRALVKCPNCGAENPSFAEKCAHCDKPLDRETERLVSPALTN